MDDIFLEFTLETEVDHNLSFLDMRLIHDHETDQAILYLMF